MLPNPALDAAAKWVPGIVSLTLFILFFIAWWRTFTAKIDKSEKEIATLKAELASVKDVEERVRTAILLQLNDYVKVSDMRATVNGIWKVARATERTAYGLCLKLDLLNLMPREEKDDA